MDMPWASFVPVALGKAIGNRQVAITSDHWQWPLQVAIANGHRQSRLLCMHDILKKSIFGYGGGPFVCVPGPSREKQLPDSREGLPDSREGGHDIDLRHYHGHVMAMIVFMGMDRAMLLACYGHAISVIINMVMEMSWP